MTNYLISIDPSIKNTAFTLWEKENISDNFIIKWKPIFIKSYKLKEYNGKRQFYWDIKVNDNELDLIIESSTFHSKMVLVMKHKNIYVVLLLDNLINY